MIEQHQSTDAPWEHCGMLACAMQASCMQAQDCKSKQQPQSTITWLTGQIEIDWDKMPFVITCDGKTFTRISELEAQLGRETVTNG